MGPTHPMGQWSYNAAFNRARAKAKVNCRLYDAHHTFVTRLAENSTVSIETVRQVTGHIITNFITIDRWRKAAAELKFAKTYQISTG